MMVDPMNTTMLDHTETENPDHPSFGAPALPPVWTMHESTSPAGQASIAHRMLVADGTLPMTARVSLSYSVTTNDLTALGLHLVRFDRSPRGSTAFLLDAVPTPTHPADRFGTAGDALLAGYL